MSKGSKRRPGKGFEEGYAKIFGDKTPERGSWVQHPITLELIPRDEYVPPPSRDRKDFYVQGDIEPFVSPITKEVINSRSQLRAHMKEHGVTNIQDYSTETLKKNNFRRNAEMTGHTKEAKQERIRLLNEELQKRGM